MPIILDGSKGETFPTWTTAGRPSTPTQGQTGYNTTLNTLETYDGSAWTPTGANPTITQTIYTSGSGTYTVPTGVKWLRVRMVGGGAGGQGSGTSQGTQPTNGGDTTFGSSFLTASGGSKATAFNVNGGLGGSATINAGATGLSLTGGSGNGSIYNVQYAYGGSGGNSAFGGGAGGASSAAGLAASSNTGGGGGGGGTSSTSQNTGPGGGAGGYIDAIISAPGASYSYAVGAGGNAGGAGTGGYAGGAGGSGVIIIEEHYNW